MFSRLPFIFKRSDAARKEKNGFTLLIVLVGVIFLGIFELWHSLIGALYAGGLIYSIRFIYFKIRDIEGIGLGDIKLFAMAGLWLGWQNVGYVLLVSALMALLGLYLIKKPNEEDIKFNKIPFGPFISLSFYLVWLVS